MEPETHDREAIRRGLEFPKHIAALKPQIFDTEAKAIEAAAALYLQRPPEPTDMARVSVTRIEHLEGGFIYFDKVCIGLLGRYFIRGNLDTYIFTPPPPLDGEEEE